MVGDRQLTLWQTMLSEHFIFDCEGLKMSGVTRLTTFIVKIFSKVILSKRLKNNDGSIRQLRQSKGLIIQM